jgi:hypothetical protein
MILLSTPLFSHCSIPLKQKKISTIGYFKTGHYIFFINPQEWFSSLTKSLQLTQENIQLNKNRVYRHRFDADPDPTFHFHAHPDPDPDPTPSVTHVG